MGVTDTVCRVGEEEQFSLCSGNNIMSLLFLKYKKVAFVLHPMNYKTLDIFVVLQTSKLDLDLLKIILYSILTISRDM